MTGELIEKIRKNWKASLTAADEFEWRRAIKAFDIDIAREALRNLYRRAPHHMPTVDQFTAEAQNIAEPGRLTDAQIALNIAGLQRMREAWQKRHASEDA